MRALALVALTLVVGCRRDLGHRATPDGGAPIVDAAVRYDVGELWPHDGGALLLDRGVPPDFRFSYSMSPCYGPCDSFDVEVRADGRVRLSGDKRSGKTPIRGCAQELIGDAGVRRLVAILNEKGFSTLARESRTDARVLGGPSDMTHKMISLAAYGKTMRLDHNLASIEPGVDQAHDLETALDDFFGTKLFLDTLVQGPCPSVEIQGH
ncbi:MAG TPA: DUF6438 domain-containing protein [Polyangiaceae bacterium]